MSAQPGIYLEVCACPGPERGYQVALFEETATGGGHGVRLLGPSFIGNSTRLAVCKVTPRLVELMRPYLDKAATEPSTDGDSQ